MNKPADIEQIKAQLAAEILRLVEARGLADAEVGARLGVAGDQVERLRRANLKEFSVDDLIGFANAFDQRVEMKVVSPEDGPLVRIARRMEKIAAEIPGEEWEKLPTDLAENHDHYLYGTPKRD